MCCLTFALWQREHVLNLSRPPIVTQYHPILSAACQPAEAATDDANNRLLGDHACLKCSWLEKV